MSDSHVPGHVFKTIVAVVRRDELKSSRMRRVQSGLVSVYWKENEEGIPSEQNHGSRLHMWK